MSKKLVLLTVLYFGSLIPYGICLPQNCPCGKSQHSYSGPLQFVLARPWSGYRVDSPTYVPFPLVISRGTREIKSALEPSEKISNKEETDLVDLKDNIKPRSTTFGQETLAADDKEAVKDESLVQESADNQAEMDGLNLLGQLFQILAFQYQKVFGGQNNLSATNSTSVKSDEDYGDYAYDLGPATQIERPETEEVARKEKRKADDVDEEKATDQLDRLNNSTTVKS